MGHTVIFSVKAWAKLKINSRDLCGKFYVILVLFRQILVIEDALDMNGSGTNYHTVPYRESGNKLTPYHSFMSRRYSSYVHHEYRSLIKKKP